MTILDILGYMALAAADIAVFAALWWHGHGRPLPDRWEKWRTHPATSWIFQIRDRPVLVGF